jgi:DNA-binding transcriptional LysR family regulator
MLRNCMAVLDVGPIYNWTRSDTKVDSMPLTISQRQIRYFVAVAEELHFGHAAKRLHISQPPLSQQIRLLESEIGVTLLRRTPRRVELTAAGQVFLEHARGILASSVEAVRAARLADSGIVGRLSIGFIHAATFTLLPEIISRFRRSAPMVELALSELGSDAQVDAIADRRLDCGLLRPPVANAAVSTRLLMSEPLVAALPAKHKLAGRTKIALNALAGEPMVIFTPHRSPLYGQVLSACLTAGFQPRIVQEAMHITTIIGLVRSGLGVALLPQSASLMRMPGIRYLPLLYQGPRAETVLAWRANTQSPLLKGFLNAAVSR